MPSYPTAVKSFVSRSAGDTIQPAHVNDIQDEVNAIEDGLLNGTAPLNSSRSTLATLSVAGGSTLASLVVSGGSTLAALVATNSTLANLSVSGGSTFAGALTIGTVLTVTGGQITFPAVQAASASANVLDDYEEGTFVPTLGGSGGQSGQVYALQVARYVKIGKLVHIQAQITLSTLGTITGNAQIQGLPFTSVNVANIQSAATVGFYTAMTSALAVFKGAIAPNVTAITLFGATAGATGIVGLVQADFSNTTNLIISATYEANA